MDFTRKDLLSGFRSLGYKGEADLAKIKSWLRNEGHDDSAIEVNGEKVVIDEAWKKTVTIAVSRDNNEEVQVKDMTGASEDPGAMPEDGGEEAHPPPPDEEKALRRRIKALEEQARMMSKGGKIAAPSIRSERERAVKAYNAKAAREGRASGYGETARATGTSFSSGDIAEAFGAVWRLKMASLYPAECGYYASKDTDVAIVKALGLSPNSLGGALLPDEFRAELIELKERTGVMRGVIGVTRMSRDTLTVPRLGSDVSGSWLTENAAISAEDKPTFDNVMLTAKKFGVLVRSSNELLNDSALSVGDIVARSMARRTGEAEDDAAVNGTGAAAYGGIRGLINKLDSNAYVTASATTWEALTWSNILSVRGKLSDVLGLGEPSYLCSSQFFYQIVHPLIHTAGGQTMAERINGTNTLMAGGFNWILCPKMPQTLPASKIALYCGWFGSGMKFGEVGSMEVVASTDRYFEYDQVAWRGIQRVDVNLHEIGASGENIVIAGLKTT